MGVQAFTQMGLTVKFTANTTAPTPVQATALSVGANQYRIINNGAATVFLGYGTSSADATANSVIPTGGGGSATRALPILPGTDEIMTFQPNAYFTGITVSGSADIYITPGDGM